PAYADLLTTLAWRLVAQAGNYDQAEAYLKQALSIHESALGKNYSVDTCVLTSGGMLYCPMTEYAWGLVELGAFYCQMEEFARAEVPLRQASDILGKAVAKLPYPYLNGLIRVGEQYLEREDCVQADKDRGQVLAYASCLDLLAEVFRKQAYYVQA